MHCSVAWHVFLWAAVCCVWQHENTPSVTRHRRFLHHSSAPCASTDRTAATQKVSFFTSSCCDWLQVFDVESCFQGHKNYKKKLMPYTERLWRTHFVMFRDETRDEHLIVYTYEISWNKKFFFLDWNVCLTKCIRRPLTNLFITSSKQGFRFCVSSYNSANEMHFFLRNLSVL